MTPQVGERGEYACPVCDGGSANATYKLDRTGDPVWFIGCWSDDCAGRRDYLEALAEELGEPGALKPRLAQLLRARGRCRRGRVVLPTPSRAMVDGWAMALASSPAYGYLRRRGIRPAVLKRYRVGYDGARATFPLLSADGVVAVVRREPRPGAQMRADPGRDRRWPLYPEVDPRPRVLIVAGMLDALAGRSVGLPAVSPPFGVRHWEDEWTEQLCGREVVVCFDNNEQQYAIERVAALREAGISARRVSLRRLGLDTPKGDLTDYLKCGNDARRVMRRRVINRAVR